MLGSRNREAYTIRVIKGVCYLLFMAMFDDLIMYTGIIAYISIERSSWFYTAVTVKTIILCALAMCVCVCV